MPALFIFLMSVSTLFGYLLCFIDYHKHIQFYQDKHDYVIGWDLRKGYDYTAVLRTKNNPYYEYCNDAPDSHEE